MSTPDHHDELESERAHLAAARAGLARMREHTARLDSAAAGDWVSQILLESAMSARMKALEDDPTVALFFGRLDYAAGHPETGTPFYIGRRHVSDERGDPMVVDWRAPISLPFYRASGREPMGVAAAPALRVPAGPGDRLRGRVAEARGRARSTQRSSRTRSNGPGWDRCATSWPPSSPSRTSSSGPTSPSRSACRAHRGPARPRSGLHRAAFLLYAHRDRLSRQGVLVVGPNSSFLRYIGDVLPALGEIDAEQTTVGDLVAATMARLHAKYVVRGSDAADVAVLKGDPRMATLVERALWSQVRVPEEGLVVPRGARRWRVATYEVEEIVAELRARGVRYGAARGMLPHRLAHAILVRMEDSGDSPDDRVQDAVARSRPVKAYVDQVWPAVDPARLVHRLLADPSFLAQHAEGLFDAAEQHRLRWDRPARSPMSARWSLADAVLVDEAADLVDRTASKGHVVADEAQDLSAMMLRAVGRRASTGSVTVLGDLAQATTPWASRSWEQALVHLGKPGAHVEQLTRGFRVPGEVIEYAARLLPVVAPGLEPPTSVRRARGDLTVTRTEDPVVAAATWLASTGAGLVGSVGVIVPDPLAEATSTALAGAGVVHDVLGREAEPAGGMVDVVPASLAKGLEFDHVVLLEPAAVVAGEADLVTGLRRLYVCLTRPVTSLLVLHAEDLPAELGNPLRVGRDAFATEDGPHEPRQRPPAEGPGPGAP